MCGKEPVDDEGIEANAFLNSLDDVSIPELSYETLKNLRDALGTSEYQRAISSIGLTDADAIAYARRTALSVCSVLQMLRSREACAQRGSHWLRARHQGCL